MFKINATKEIKVPKDQLAFSIYLAVMEQKDKDVAFESIIACLDQLESGIIKDKNDSFKFIVDGCSVNPHFEEIEIKEKEDKNSNNALICATGAIKKIKKRIINGYDAYCYVTIQIKMPCSIEILNSVVKTLAGMDCKASFNYKFTLSDEMMAIKKSELRGMLIEEAKKQANEILNYNWSIKNIYYDSSLESNFGYSYDRGIARKCAHPNNDVNNSDDEDLNVSPGVILSLFQRGLVPEISLSDHITIEFDE